MNILAASYKNIGPFNEKLLTLNFKSGKFLIKAPIGSGKSFLFFDGPVYALYRNSGRNILNTKANEGFIHLLFESEGSIFLVKRDIKPTKSGNESVKSSFYTINNDIEEINSIINKNFSETINQGIDILEVLQKEANIENVAFKSQQELQSSIEELVPPKEVFLNTNFLMQDSDNIFELPPQERIKILKNIFGLLGIDDAKDKIMENKRQTQASLKVKKDTSSMDNKFKENISYVYDKRQKIFDISLNDSYFLDKLKESYQGLMDDFSLVGESINIESFDISLLDTEVIKNLLQDIEERKSQYQTIKGEMEGFKNSLQESQDKEKELSNKKENIQIQIKELDEYIQKIDESKIKDLKEQRKTKVEKQSEIEKDIDYGKITSLGYEANDIYEVVGLIDKLIEQGKSLKSEGDRIEEKQQNIKKEKENLEQQKAELELKDGTRAFQELEKEKSTKKDNLNSQIKNIETQLNNYQERQKNLNESLENINNKISKTEKDLSFQEEFYCDKIDNNCPYIEKINKSTIDLIKKQKEDLEKEKQDIETKIKNEELEKTISDLQSQKENIEKDIQMLDKNPEKYLTDFFEKIEKEKQEIENKLKELNVEKTLEELDNQKKEIHKQLDASREFFKNIDWKTIKSSYEEYKNIDKEIKELDKNISQLEEEINKLQDYKDKKTSLDSELKSIESQITQLEKEKASIEEKISSYDKKLEDFNIQGLYSLEELIESMKSGFDKMKELLEEYKSMQLEVKSLQEEDKILGDLQNIFGKELMLVVLDEFLPSLQEGINNLLAQVVDYEVKTELIRKNNDNLELEIKIHDKKGIRYVKSLSGGQRVVLRLVWVFTVASLKRLDFLFLDETINNLDYSTVGKLAELTKDFIKVNNLKFYVVTHSQQIQDMDIWDEIIDLDRIG